MSDQPITTLHQVCIENSLGDIYGKTPLHYAVDAGNLATVKLLIYAGALVNKKDNDGYPAIHRAVSDGHVEIFDLLISSGAKYKKYYRGETLLHVASANGHDLIVQKLLDLGFDVDERFFGRFDNPTDDNKTTPIHYAVDHGSFSTYKILKDAGANLKLKNASKLSLLYVSSAKGHILIVQDLIDLGLDVNEEMGHGETALNVAVRFGHLPVVELLIANHAKINPRFTLQ